jgi:hypothetical protein
MLEPDAPFFPLSDFRVAVVHCLMMACAPTAYVALIHRTRRTWQELHALVGVDVPPLEDQVGGSGYRGRVLTAVMLVVGLTVAIYITYATTPERDPFDLSEIHPEVVWHRIFTPIVVVYVSFLSVAIVSTSLALSAAGRRIAALDLLDPRQVAPFRSQALLNSLVIVLMAACASPMGFESHLATLVVGIWIFAGCLATVGLLLPLVGVRERIRELRTSELDWCDAGLRAARDALKAPSAGAGDGRFAELHAYRQRIEHVPEWPLDTPSFVRFALYLLIPLGSWLGGALVERAVDALVQ